MSDLRRNCERVLRAYPARYRRDRGEEILETLVDVTPPGRRYPPGAEVVALVGQGLRQRVGLAPAQPAGQLVDVFAGPILAMAGVLVLAAMVFGEWDPWFRLDPLFSRTPPPWGFGPFFTDGVPLYLIVAGAAAAWALGRRRAARWLAASSWCVTAVIVVFGHLAPTWGRPPLSFLGSVLLLTVPALLTSSAGAAVGRSMSHRSVVRRAAIMIVVVEAVVLAGYGSFEASRPADPAVFYRVTVPGIGHWVPVVAAIGLLVCLVSAARGNLRGGPTSG